MLDKIKKFFNQEVKNPFKKEEPSYEISPEGSIPMPFTFEFKEERYKRLDAIHDKLDQERVEARRLTKEGKTSEAAVQWDIVEELSAEAADRTWYEKWCDENPSDHNCKMYDI